MSDKGLLFKTRKNNHGSHNRCSRGSEFPRHDMNRFPGTHLGMKLRYQKPSVGRLYKEWSCNCGYIRTNRITGFINKFIGKPYNDLVKAFYVLIKDLRNSHKEVGLADLEWHFEQFRYRRWRGDYYVDDDGLVQVVRPESDEIKASSINKQQVAYNKGVQIPDFGRVSIPRKLGTDGKTYWSKYGFPDEDHVYYEKPQYRLPQFIGNYWCDMDGKMLLLPVYHVPGSSEYARYWSDTHGKPKPKERGYYYYGNYPQKWDRSGFCDKFSDKFRPGDYRYKWAQGLENGWVIPLIPFGKRTNAYSLSYSMYKRMQHTKRMLLPNTKELNEKKERVIYYEKQLEAAGTPGSWWTVERAEEELNKAVRDLENTPETAYFEMGYGQLYPMVKRYDYEKALRIYEQEQEETSMEGQE